MSSLGMLRRVILLRTNVSKERIASIIRVIKIGELGTNIAVTSNRRIQLFLQEPEGVTSQRTAFFMTLRLLQSPLMEHVYQIKCCKRPDFATLLAAGFFI
jgi:hypothetical protein